MTLRERPAGIVKMRVFGNLKIKHFKSSLLGTGWFTAHDYLETIVSQCLTCLALNVFEVMDSVSAVLMGLLVLRKDPLLTPRTNSPWLHAVQFCELFGGQFRFWDIN
jgi:hypothetical protein